MRKKDTIKLRVHKKIYNEVHKELRYFLKYEPVAFKIFFEYNTIRVVIEAFDVTKDVYLDFTREDHDLPHFYEFIADYKEYCRLRFGF